ncbi:MAG: stage II sporulation protein M [Nitrosopumilaceae archaeon]
MSDKKRIITFFIFVGLFSTSFAVGAETTVSEEEAKLFHEQFEVLFENIDSVGIFLHNLRIALPMFIPGFGVVWGFFASWQTGVAFSAFKTINPALTQIPSLSILYLTPFGLMELAAYSIAMSRSLLLVQKLIKKIPIKLDSKITGIEVSIVVVLLLAGGFIEAYMIELFEKGELQVPEI